MEALNTLMLAAQEFAAQLLIIALPILAAACAGLVLAKTRDALAKMKLDANDNQRYLIETSAEFVVMAAEQMKRAKLLPTSAKAKGWAIQALNDKLGRHGISLPTVELADLIEAAVWTELNRDKRAGGGG